MEQIALGDTGRTTSRLGFGCSSLMGATGHRESLRLLESAFDAGIRHFDVAPMYGYGDAEGCLGEFLERYRDQVTVTTKYGIASPRRSSLVSLARNMARPIVRTLPALKRRMARVAQSAIGGDEKASFTPTQAKGSLERSLKALRTDHIDLWLLHEVSALDLKDEGLLHLLEDMVRQGVIGSFGIGSGADKVPGLVANHSAYCRTLQYEWSVLDAAIELEPEVQGAPFRIHHRSLTDNFRSLHAALVQDKQVCGRWSAATNTDLSKPDVLASLMLKASLVMNPRSVILFSSKNPRHIEANVAIAEDATLESAARQLYTLIQREKRFVATSATS